MWISDIETKVFSEIKENGQELKKNFNQENTYEQSDDALGD